MSTEKSHVKGVLLVGSVPGNDTEDVLRRIAPALGSRLKYIPDGETGQRNFFIGWQMYKVCTLWPRPLGLTDGHDTQVWCFPRGR